MITLHVEKIVRRSAGIKYFQVIFSKEYSRAARAKQLTEGQAQEYGKQVLKRFRRQQWKRNVKSD